MRYFGIAFYIMGMILILYCSSNRKHNGNKKEGGKKACSQKGCGEEADSQESVE